MQQKGWSSMFVIRVTNGKDHWIVGPFDSQEEALAWKEDHVDDLLQSLELCIIHPVTHPDEAYQ